MVLGSDLFDYTIDHVDRAAAIAILLLTHLLHDPMPARITLQSIWLLSFYQIPELSLLVRAKLSLLCSELVIVEFVAGRLEMRFFARILWTTGLSEALFITHALA